MLVRIDLSEYLLIKRQHFVVLSAGMYNITELVLEWEEVSPISFDPELRLTEYNLQRFWFNETIVISNGINLRHGAFSEYLSLFHSIS